MYHFNKYEAMLNFFYALKTSSVFVKSIAMD